MINYYYELKPGTSVLGRDEKYIAQFDFNPTRAMSYEFKIHDDAMLNSSRVWMENANGVTLIKGPITDTSWGQVNEQELVWLKLICRDIETL
jgi:hypothetical protein